MGKVKGGIVEVRATLGVTTSAMEVVGVGLGLEEHE